MLHNNDGKEVAHLRSAVVLASLGLGPLQVYCTLTIRQSQRYSVTTVSR